MKTILDYYKVDMERDIVYNLKNDPSEEEFLEVYGSIVHMLEKAKKARPMENIVIIFLFAGHGILKDGCQTLVLNEFDPNTKFYKLLTVEDKIRTLSNTYPNIYNIAIFACCRELWRHEDMIGKCIPNPNLPIIEKVAQKIKKDIYA